LRPSRNLFPTLGSIIPALSLPKNLPSYELSKKKALFHTQKSSCGPQIGGAVRGLGDLAAEDSRAT